LSFQAFKEADPDAADQPVTLPVRAISQAEAFSLPNLAQGLAAAGLVGDAALDAGKSWTLVILEDFKEAATTLSPGRLNWVLRTAMPLTKDFAVYLNSQRVVSSKEDYKVVASFTIDQLPPARIETINKKTGYDWSIQERLAPGRVRAEQSKADLRLPALVCPRFDEGIFAEVLVTKRPIYGGKSDDLIRSNGFFVRVRDRLINENDELFGLPAQSHEVWNRFRADIDADDLDQDLTAPREGVGLGRQLTMIAVLTELHHEARSRFTAWSNAETKPQIVRAKKIATTLIRVTLSGLWLTY